MPTVVAITGRPNTGKSTLFNRLTESRQAIVDATAGVTRDRHYGQADWKGKHFSVIDTGGYVIKNEDIYSQEIRQQVELAVEEADIIIFLTDVTTGITETDQVMARWLHQSGKKVFLVVNKVDNPERSYDTAEFYKLGFDNLFSISAASGAGTGELLDELVKYVKDEEPLTSLPRLAIIGRPNTGKSSLMNALVGKKRSIVTPHPGTTRDAIDVRYSAFGFDFILIDTAGLRKKSRVKENLEFYSVMRTVRAIEHADVCLLMLDATEGIQAQDISIFHLAERNKKGIVILVNKWDLIPAEQKNTRYFEEVLHQRLAPFNDVPVVFTSVLKKQRIHRALKIAMEVYQNRQQKISTSLLNETLLPILEATPPPSVKGKNIKIKYITQLAGNHPRFVFFANLPQYIKEPYKRFIENQMRQHFNLTGVPISLIFKRK
jgi:GTP-binding protein